MVDQSELEYIKWAELMHRWSMSLRVPEFDERQMARSPPPGTPTPHTKRIVDSGVESPPQPPPLDDPCRLLEEDDLFSLEQGGRRVFVDKGKKEIDIRYTNTKTRIEINLV